MNGAPEKAVADRNFEFSGVSAAASSSAHHPLRSDAEDGYRGSLWRPGYPAGHAFLVAARLHTGNELIALRQLQEIEASELCLSPNGLERVRRVVMQYRSTAHTFCWPVREENVAMR